MTRVEGFALIVISSQLKIVPDNESPVITIMSETKRTNNNNNNNITNVNG